MSNAATTMVIGGGPAGLMAAETLLEQGCAVQLYESAPSLARKFLIAGKGGLNLTHSEPSDQFIRRYRERQSQVQPWLSSFGAEQLRRWAKGLGVETIVGSSGRVFPADFKAGPLLRAWVHRLRQQGLQLRTGVRFCGWSAAGQVCLQPREGEPIYCSPDALILALGGSSWSKLGASGTWVQILREAGVEVVDLAPSNCGFECAWSEHFQQRYAGQPLKQITARVGSAEPLRGEAMLTRHGVEGSLIYALSAPLRQQLEAVGSAELIIDLCPDRDLPELKRRLGASRGRRSWSEFLRRQLGLVGSRYGLLRELCTAEEFDQPSVLAEKIKRLPLRLLATRPIDEAISCAGGVRFEALTDDGMLKAKPGVWCAGEMIDWEAPTGGYLLTACFASGRAAGLAAARWVHARLPATAAKSG